MNNTVSVREQLTFRAWLQIFFLVASLALTFLYSLPKMEEISLQVDAANTAAEKYQSLHDNGIAFSNLVSVLRSHGENTELIEIINNSPQEVQKVIQKTGNSPYLSWVVDSLTSSEQDKMLLSASRARINSIIPTLSPVSGNIDENSVTLREYITFVEQKILKNFSLSSFSSLGIEWVKYKNSEKNTIDEKSEKTNIIKTVNEIWEFLVKIDFEEATNKNISDALHYIHSLGEPSVLSESGALVTPIPVMSNPLVVIDSLSLEKNLNLDAPNAVNKGSLVLKFYIRGSSETDREYLREAFNKRRTELSEKISEKISECRKDTSCVELERLEAVEGKLKQFSRSFDYSLSKSNSNNIEAIYMIGQQMQSLNSIRLEFENIK